MEKELKDYEKLVNIHTIRDKVNGYVQEHFKEEKCLLDPIFREEDGKYYLCYAIIDFVDEKNNDLRIKRPTKWLLVDIVTGELFKIYDSKDYDYTDAKKLPLDRMFVNNGNTSALYDSSNFISMSYFKWKKQVIKELNEKFNQDGYNQLDPKVLRLENETISPNTFVLANVEDILEELYDKITNNLGDKVQQMYEDYYVYIIDLIRKHYVISEVINPVLLSSYIDLLKYAWPDLIDLINAIDNIEHFNDLNFETKLRNLAKNKENDYKKDNVVFKIDEKLKEINPDYKTNDLSDAKIDKDKKYTLDDLIDRIDEKIIELETKENQ